MTPLDVARLFDCAPATVRKWESRKKLPAIRTRSGMRLFSREDVDRLLASRRAVVGGKRDGEKSSQAHPARKAPSRQ